MSCRWTIVLLLPLALTPAAGAQRRFAVRQSCGAAVVCQTPVVVQQTEVIVPVLTPFVFQADPRISYLYSGGIAAYGGYGQAQQPAPGITRPAPADQPALEQKLDRMLDLMERMIEQQHPRAGPPDVPGWRKAPVASATRSYVDVLRENCSECHTEGRLRKNSFTLFAAAGGLAPGWDAQRVFDAMNGRMPPAPRARVSAADRSIVDRAFGIKVAKGE